MFVQNKNIFSAMLIQNKITIVLRFLALLLEWWKVGSQLIKYRRLTIAGLIDIL